MTRLPQTGLVLAAALAGLAVAIALALLTSHLTTQHVGLAGDPSRPAPGLVAPVARPAPAAPTTPSHSGEIERRDD